MMGVIRDFILNFVKEKGCPENVLEVGSLDINGNVRNIFGCAYTGIDLEKGANVDIVMDAVDIKERFKEEEFDMVMCLETLEHAKDPLTIVNNMRWVLQKGGWMIITTPGTGFGIHNYPCDYYRFFESTYRDIFFKDFEDCYIKSLTWDGNNPLFPDAVWGYGRKPND